MCVCKVMQLFLSGSQAASAPLHLLPSIFHEPCQTVLDSVRRLFSFTSRSGPGAASALAPLGGLVRWTKPAAGRLFEVQCGLTRARHILIFISHPSSDALNLHINDTSVCFHCITEPLLHLLDFALSLFSQFQ